MMSTPLNTNRAGFIRALFIVASIALCGWWFVGRTDDAAKASTPGATAEVAAEDALREIVKGVVAWKQATGTAIGAPHPGVSLAAGNTLWGVATTVKHQGGVACAIAGSLDGGEPRIQIAPDTAPCTQAGIAELQGYICTQEQLTVCPKP